VSTAPTLWVPAVNNHGGFGGWAFVEVADLEGSRATELQRLAASDARVTVHKGDCNNVVATERLPLDAAGPTIVAAFACSTRMVSM
jgi:hypothetical protein